LVHDDVVRPVDHLSTTHRVWGDGCNAGDLLSEHDLQISEEQMPPGTIDAHHRKGAEHRFMYTIEGRLEVEVDGRGELVVQFQGLYVPANTEYRVRNPGPGRARHLVITAPLPGADAYAASVA
jgi:mannose-6-phosphate isomerase-like protein (cupin superfamily)